MQGVDLGPSCAFLGIPFAAPPLGDLALETATARDALGARDAECDRMGCPVQMSIRRAARPPVATEDCLKLNIWTPDPAPASPAPVIVWIHTGAFQAASANLPDSNGRKTRRADRSHRRRRQLSLGPFGFLGHRALTAEDPGYRSSGNYGFLDQRAALAWVRDHIAAFGGDPNNVTIAGQSAGGNSVSLHVVSPGSAGYFNRAIMQSGYASTRWPTLADAEALGDRLRRDRGVHGSVAGADVPALEDPEPRCCWPFRTASRSSLRLPRVAWGPVVDGLDIPDQPRRLYEVARSTTYRSSSAPPETKDGSTWIEASRPA